MSWLHNLATWGIDAIDSTEKDLLRLGKRLGFMPLSWQRTIIDHPEKDGLLWRVPDPTVGMASSMVRIQAIFVADYERAIVLKDGKLSAPKDEKLANHLVLPPGSYSIERNSPIRGQIAIIWLTTKDVSLSWGVADVLTRDGINIGASGSCFVSISDPVEFVRKVAGSTQVYKQEHLEEFVKPEIKTIMRKLIAQRTVMEFQTARDALVTEAKQDLDKSFGHWGLALSSLTIEHQNVPQEFLDAVQKNTVVTMEKTAELTGETYNVLISKVGVEKALYEGQAAAIKTFLEGQATADVMSLLKSRGIDPVSLKLIEAIKDMQPSTGTLADPRSPFFADITKLIPEAGSPTGTLASQWGQPNTNSPSSLNTTVQPIIVEDPVSEKSGRDKTLLIESPDQVSQPSHAEENPVMQQIFSEIQELRQDFDTKLKYDEGKQKTIDTLHKELEEHRTGLHFKILRPVFLDLIHLYDDLEKMIESMPAQPEQSNNRTLEDLRLLQGEVVEILGRYGAEAFSLDGPLQANKQRVLKTIETTDSTLDKHVAKSLRKGFSYENRILRPEQVVVYKFVGK